MDRSLRGRAGRALLLVPLLLGLSGCSYADQIFLDGRLFVGVGRTPVVGATIRVVNGTNEIASARTDEFGEWHLDFMMSFAEFRSGTRGRCIHNDDGNSRYRLRVEVDGTTKDFPFPRLVVRTAGDPAYATILFVLEPPLTVNPA